MDRRGLSATLKAAGNIFDRIKKIYSAGFFHIFFSGAANKIITAIAGIMIIRILGKYDYGVLGAATNIYNIFAVFSGFGMDGAILVYCSENRPETEKRGYYSYGLTAGFISSALISLGMLVYARFGRISIPEAKNCIIYMSALPMLSYLMQHFLVVLRTKKRNKSYSAYINLNGILYLVLGCIGAYFCGIRGVIAARYTSYTAVIILCGVKLLPQYAHRSLLDNLEKKELWRYSLKNGLSSAINRIFYLADIALIAALIKEAEAVASYKVAVMLPEAMSFIPTAVIIYFIPSIAEHSKDSYWLKTNIKKLFLFSGAVNAAISAFLIIFAPFIISTLWGREYLDSVVCFRILSINYFFVGTFRVTCTNALAVLKKVNFNLLVSTSAVLINIGLDYILISNYASTGAAAATLMTVMFVSAVSAVYLIHSIREDDQ